MEYKDYYKIMGLERTANADEIKKAYRKLARKYHPDVSKEANAEAKFKDVGEAYEVLKDPEKRASYDQLGSNWQAGQDFRPPPGWQHAGQGGGFGQGDFGGAEDFFESLFGGGGMGSRFGGRQRARHGEDFHGKIHVSLEDALNGTVRQVQIPLSTGTKTLKVKVPAGVRPGKQIRLAGQGAPGVGGGKHGDLLLEIQFDKHRLFELIESDVYLTLPLTPWEAALGATIAVPTLAGKVDLKIPANSQAGQKLRLKGRGLPGTPQGDQYVLLKIMTPPAKSETEKKLYETMAKEMPFNPRESM